MPNTATEMRGFGIDSCQGIEIHHIKKTLHKVIHRNGKKSHFSTLTYTEANTHVPLSMS